MHGIKLARLATAVAEAGEDFECVAKQNVDFLGRTVGKKDVFLLGVLGKSDVPGRAVTESPLRDESFFHESAVFLEHLDAIVGAITDIEKAVARKFGAMHRIAKLLRGWRV